MSEELANEVAQLRQRLADTEQALRAIAAGQVDAVVAGSSATPTLLREAQAQLRRRERRLRAVFDHSRDAMALTDAAGLLVDVNPAACRVYGRAKEALVGSDPAQFYERSFDVRQARATLQESGQVTGELVVVQPGGIRRSVEFLAVADIEPGVNLAVLHDVTDRRETEQRLQRAEADLRQAQKMEAIGVLAGGIAHDFNNLLSVIISYTSFLIEETGESDPRYEDLMEIKRAGYRAAEMTRQLLTFSRKQVLQPRVLDLNESVASMRNMLRHVLTGTITLSVLPATGLYKVHADPGQIEQLIMNLVVNARDAMPAGGNLSIETANVDLFDGEAVGVVAGAYAMLAVTDTGIGMTAETQSRIFEPFFTTKEPGRGTGLGLSTVFGIVKQSQGHVAVESAPGKGTTFKIYLPRDTSAGADARGPRGRPATMSLPLLDVPRGSETILLVEDEEQVRALVRRILQRHGYHVLEAQNAGEALLVAEQYTGTIHLILTDVVMPRLDGHKMVQRVGKLRPLAKVIYMTGYAADVQRELENADYLPKPILPDALLAKVRETLDTPPPIAR